MIVKVIVTDDLVEIFHQNSERLFYSDAKTDIEFARKLVGAYPIFNKAGLKVPNDKNYGYFSACWLNKKVTIRKPVYGYEF